MCGCRPFARLQTHASCVGARPCAHAIHADPCRYVSHTRHELASELRRMCQWGRAGGELSAWTRRERHKWIIASSHGSCTSSGDLDGCIWHVFGRSSADAACSLDSDHRFARGPRACHFRRQSPASPVHYSSRHVWHPDRDSQHNGSLV